MSALLTPEQIASVCLSYRHDFGLLEDGDRHRLMFMAREWERAMSHEISAPLLAEIERLTAELSDLRQQLQDERHQHDVTRGDLERTRLVRDEVIAELCAAREDAERYRWLRSNPQWLGWEHDFRPDEVEREIDAARSAT